MEVENNRQADEAAKQKKIAALSGLLGKLKDSNGLTAQLIKKKIEKIETEE